MSMSDPISDFLTRIRNGLSSNKKWVDIPSSKIKKRIALILKEENFIEDFYFISDDDSKETIRIFLRYDYNGEPTIDQIRRVSRPGLRVYVSSKQIPRVLDGLGISILSTSKGVMSNKTATKLKIGGEILCEVF
tara:strand:+ start:996 stop:1397 length:402 start_codon:yes stop_codon:yes gene_type:complete